MSNLDPRLGYARGLSTGNAVQESNLSGSGAFGLLQSWADLGAQIAGYGPRLAKLVQDPQVTDILVNGPTEIWIDRGHGLKSVDLPLGNHADLRSLAVRLAGACGKRLDDAAPIADGTLPGGVRLHAVLPPLAQPFPVISLRCPRAKGWNIQELVATGMVPKPLLPLVTNLVLHKAATFISGATGSGKTTLLAALLGLVPASERIVCIEEVSELKPHHPHVVHLQERHPNLQGKGAIPMSLLVRAAMRMRPDRIVLGECRGPEVREVLSAMNTGHEGAWATIHANAVSDVPARLVALGALANMPADTVAAQVLAGVDVFLHIKREMIAGKLQRWISELGLPSLNQGRLQATLAVSCTAQGQITYHPAWQSLAQKLGLT